MMSKGLGALTFSALLFGFSLAGCLSGDDLDIQRDGPVKSFTAIYARGGSDVEWALEFDGPWQVMDRDEKHRMAYALTAYPLEPGVTTNRFVYYLDDDLQVVRVDRVCHMKNADDECTHHRSSYAQQGTLPAYGAFWRHHVDDEGVMKYSTWAAELQIQPTVHQHEDGSFTLEVETGMALAPVRGGHSVLGTYTYEGDTQIPVRFTQASVESEGFSYRLVSYEEGAQLDKADRWPKETGPAPWRDRSARVFPGEDEDPYGSGSTPKEARDWLLGNSDSAADLYKKGCVQVQSYDPPSPILDFSHASGTPLQEDTYRHKIRILLPDTGFGRVWTVAYKTGLLGSHYEIEREDTFNHPGGMACQDLHDAPEPSMSMAQFIERTDAFPVTAHGTGNFVYAVGGLGSPEGGWYVVHHPEEGREFYTRQYIPGFVDLDAGVVSYTPYYLDYLAAPEWITEFLVHPDDVKSIDDRSL